jgi:primosomal protein N' (replication factor Y) (superfamily II helicase)
MPNYARIAVNIPSLSGVFDYHLPSELNGRLGVGALVTVPFGKQTVQGVVVELITEPSVPETKPVLDVLDAQPVLTAAQIEFSQRLADFTLNSLAAVVGMMLPPGLSQQADVLYSLNPSPFVVGEKSHSSTQKRLLDLLDKRGPLRGRQIDRHFAQVDWRKSAQMLVKVGVVEARSVLPPPRVRPKHIRTAQLAVPPQAAEEAMSSLGRQGETLKRRQAALRFLMNEPQAVNVSWVYAESNCTLVDLQELAERELILLQETEIFRDPLQHIDIASLQNPTPLDLTRDQQKVWDEVQAAFLGQANGQTLSPFLLHGVTGSGKTEIYLRATAEAVRRGRQALILVPEISLTPQMVRRFLARFPGQVGLVHSKLSEGERYDTWRRARNGQLKVIIGARSALFAPLSNPGLIVLDECHDTSYYQSEPPFYHAVAASQMYARICGAVCILGSATPPVALRYQAEGRGLRLMELPRRLTPLTDGGVTEGTPLPPVRVVDMREELKTGHRGIFSNALVEALAGVLERREQAILYLNRRGTATYVFCRSCGTTVKCPECETLLIFHTQLSGVELLCHRCGYTRRMPKKCAVCGSDQIRQYGLGSEKVEQEVRSLFPKAEVMRWDWETTREKDAHELILTHFSAHHSDILVGTQLLAKGLDLPLVTLVGIVLADAGLNLPDPFAYERGFQLLTQVAGRAGRSERGGQVIMQTFMPENEVIQAASQHDYAGFYQQEISNRSKLGYPPFNRLVRLEFQHKHLEKAEKHAREVAAMLNRRIEKEKRIETDLIGPVPCFFPKQGGYYRWQVILRGPEPASLLKGRLPEGWRIEVDPANLL